MSRSGDRGSHHLLSFAPNPDRFVGDGGEMVSTDGKDDGCVPYILSILSTWRSLFLRERSSKNSVNLLRTLLPACWHNAVNTSSSSSEKVSILPFEEYLFTASKTAKVVFVVADFIGRHRVEEEVIPKTWSKIGSKCGSWGVLCEIFTGSPEVATHEGMEEFNLILKRFKWGRELGVVFVVAFVFVFIVVFEDFEDEGVLDEDDDCCCCCCCIGAVIVCELILEPRRT